MCRSNLRFLWGKPDCDWCEGHSWYLCHLSCTVPLLTCWIHGSGTCEQVLTLYSNKPNTTRVYEINSLWFYTAFLMHSICFVYVFKVFGTAMLLLCLMALSDQKNKPAAAGSEPIAVGLLVLLIGISLGSNSGYAINPTRDIAPRVFTAIAGWGVDVFRYTKTVSSNPSATI